MRHLSNTLAKVERGIIDGIREMYSAEIALTLSMEVTSRGAFLVLSSPNVEPFRTVFPDLEGNPHWTRIVAEAVDHGADWIIAMVAILTKDET